MLALTVAMAWNPPTQTVHTFTTASDYVAEKDSGCTNSGEGCHGSETAYKDFNDYHPDASCTTCHDYQGVGCIPCHAPREHECALCHDGSMKTAPDRVRISDPYPHGHYRETTHTAIATNMDDGVASAPGGRAKALCRDCHSRDLKTAHTGVPVVEGSEYGTDIGCGECHNDVRSLGQAEVLSDWKSRTCESCHKIGTSSPMHATTVAASVKTTDEGRCSGTGDGCHASTDLHALHPDAPSNCSGSAEKGEPGCHKLGVEAHAPTARGCGGDSDRDCHRAGSSGTYIHRRTGTEHSPKTGAPAGDRSYQGVACGSCHAMQADGRSLITEHERSTSVSSHDSDRCINCHDDASSQEALADDWEERDSARSCTVCHDSTGLDAPHSAELAVTHAADGSDGCADSGAGCHAATSLADVGDTPTALHRSCLRCHALSETGGNLTYDPSKSTCGSGRDCHADSGEYDPKTGIHAAGTAPIGGTDKTHHTAGAAQLAAGFTDAASGVSVVCSECHGGILGVEHTRANTGIPAGDECAACHNANATTSGVVKSDWQAQDGSKACAACHDGDVTPTAHGSIETVHAATEIDREGVITDGACARAGCHVSADARVVHAALGCTFANCHSAAGDIRGLAVMSCGGIEGQRSCHAGTTRHADKDAKHVATEIDRYGEPTPGSCQREGCHETTDVRQLHETTHCETPGCHTTGGPTNMTCGGPDGTEGSCHTSSGRHADKDAKHVATEIDRYGEPTPGSCQREGCHETTDVRQLHETTHCETPGCHTTGGPTNMTCGGPDGTEGSCHNSSGRHADKDAKHVATEHLVDGTVAPGTCVGSGCHPTTDVRQLHESTHCETDGCHATGGPTYMSCGGTSGDPTCHTLYSDTEHFAGHASDLSGDIGGITYGPGENEGCVGVCHSTDLVDEHSARLQAGELEGGSVNACRICHNEDDDAGSGAFAALPAVTSAIASGDRRCVACHASGSTADSPNAVASPPATCLPSFSIQASHEQVTTPTAERIESRRQVARRASIERRTPGKPNMRRHPDRPEPSRENTPTSPEDTPADTASPNEDAPRTTEPEAGDAVSPECPTESPEGDTTTTVPPSAQGVPECLTCHVAEGPDRAGDAAQQEDDR